MINKEIKEKEKKPGFNIIDVIIVLFIILAAVGIVMRYNLADKINLNAHGDKFEIEFIINNIQEASLDFLNPEIQLNGVSFYVTIESIKIGEVTHITASDPAAWQSEKLDGEIQDTVLPGRIDVRGVMVSTGRNKDGEFMINGNLFVAPGKEFFVHTGKWEGLIQVISVKVAE